MKTQRAFIKITAYVSLAYHEALLQPSHLNKERVNVYVCQTPFSAITLIRSAGIHRQKGSQTLKHYEMSE